MRHSYVMGVDSSIHELEALGFVIEADGDNYMVTFPDGMEAVWEEFIRSKLEIEYWNEYLTDSGVVFTFHLREGFRRYEVQNFENAEVLALCEELCSCKFGSLRAILTGNHFYNRILSFEN